MVMRVPAPFTSIDPPSRTTRWSPNRWLPLLQAEFFGDMVGDFVVELPVVVLGPGVELPVRDGDGVFVFHEDRAGVACPDAVGGPLVEVDARDVCACALQDSVGAFCGGCIVDEDVHVLDAGEVADDVGVDPGDGREFARPVVGVVRPGDPGGGVRVPLGGHAVVVVSWGVLHLLVPSIIARLSGQFGLSAFPPFSQTTRKDGAPVFVLLTPKKRALQSKASHELCSCGSFDSAPTALRSG